MDPPKPPLPSPRYLPFQPIGSHTSNSIRESTAGSMTPRTRQKAGSAGNGAAEAAGSGTILTPAATASAPTIVVAGSASDRRSSHDDARSRPAPDDVEMTSQTHEAAAAILINPPRSKAACQVDLESRE